MSDLLRTVNEYLESCRIAAERIKTLNHMIRVAISNEEPDGDLRRRRCLLHREIGEMRRDVDEICCYLIAIGQFHSIQETLIVLDKVLSEC